MDFIASGAEQQSNCLWRRATNESLCRFVDDVNIHRHFDNSYTALVRRQHENVTVLSETVS